MTDKEQPHGGGFPKDNGKGIMEEGVGTQNVPPNSELQYTNEPERMFHRQKRLAAERARLEQEEEALRQSVLEQRNLEGEFYVTNNQLYTPVNPPRNYNNFAQNVPPAPVQQRNNRQVPRMQHQHQMEQSLKEFSTPTLGEQAWCIDTDNAEDNFEVKTGVVHYLPKFAGLPGEVASQHLKEFEGVCKTLKPYAAPEERFKLRVFPFSLIDIAKTWFLSLPAGSIRSWDQMQAKFLEKFYPVGKIHKVRRELLSIKQGSGESTYDYMERFSGLERCCNHGIPDPLLIEYLLDGLRPLERKLLDAAAGGTVMNLTPTEIRYLLKETAESERFRDESTRRDDMGRTRNVSQVDTMDNKLVNEMKEMREMMSKLMVAQVGGVKACEFCNSHSHRTDECPTLHAENVVDVNAMGGYQQQYNNQPRKFGLAANGYSWKDSGFTGQQQQNQHQQPYQAPHQRQGYQNQQRKEYHQAGPSNANSGQEKSFEDFVRDQLKELSKVVGVLTADVAELKKEKGRLPSQTEPNPKCGVNSISLRSGKELSKENADLEKDKDGVIPKERAGSHSFPYADMTGISENSLRSACSPESGKDSKQAHPPLPFPSQLEKAKKNKELDEELLKLFGKVEISIPLVDAIKHIPKYAGFLKELCTTRRGNSRAEQVSTQHNVSTIFSCNAEPKCDDQGTFLLSCILGNTRMDHCMLDLGSAINVIPYSLYRTLQLGPLQPTHVVVQLANKSCTSPEGVLVDVTVRVQDLNFLADFYVLKNDTKARDEMDQIILGRPFLATAKTKINSWTGKVTMQAHGKKVSFNNYDEKHDPPDIAGNLVIKSDQRTVNGCEVQHNEDVVTLGFREAIKDKEKSGRTVHEPGEVIEGTREDHAQTDNGKTKLTVFGKKGPDKEFEMKAPPI